ncbi:MAG TPA: AAA family ATPase [Lapillicoccus sp.]
MTIASGEFEHEDAVPPGARTGSRRELVGRSDQLAKLEHALSRARAGLGSIVVVSGEPGIGKTAFLTAVEARVAEVGGRVLSGRAVENAGPFGVLAQALLPVWRSSELRDAVTLRPFRHAVDRVLPGWMPGAGASAGDLGVDPALMLAEGVLQILSGVDAEFGILSVDDAQYADPDTVAVLESCAATVSRRPVLVVLARDDWPRSSGLDRIASSSGTIRLPLSRLSPPDLHTLVGHVRDLPADVVQSIVDRSEGLPAVAAELAAAVTTEESDWAVPQGFAVLVEARLVGLDDTDRRLLAAAAALGGEPDWDVVPAIAGVDDAAAASGLRDAVRAHLLSHDQGDLRWRHGLIRQIVWANLLPPERRSVTRAAAQALLDRGGPTDRARAAGLLSQVGDADTAAELWLELTDAAVGSGGLRTAAELLDRAESTGRRRTAVAVGRVNLMALTGRPVEALDIGLPALSDARGDEHAELCLRLARAAAVAGRWAETEQLLARAGRPADPRSATLLSDAAHATGRMADAERYALAAVNQARLDGPIEVLCEALCAQARLDRLHHPASARATFAEAAQLASEHGLLPWRVEALLGLATIDLLIDEESPDLLEVHRIALDAGLLGRAAQADLLLADHVLVRDGPAGSAEPATRVAEFGRLARIDYFTFAGETLLASRSALAGDERAMEFRLSRLDAGRDLPPDSRIQIAGVRGQAAMVRHDLDAAADLLDAAMRPLAEHRSAAPLVLFGAWALVETLVRADPTEVRGVLADQTAGQRRANLGALRYADAVVAGRAGDRTGAEAALAGGDELLAPTPWWRRFLRTVALEAAVTEEWADAVPRLRIDLAAFEAAGEEQLARTVRDLLRRAGAPTRRGRGDSTVPIGLRAVGVTSREMDVLRLLEGGLSNADIGARLFLSPRTVETHVANLLTKSGASNRVELVTWAAPSLTP